MIDNVFIRKTVFALLIIACFVIFSSLLLFGLVGSENSIDIISGAYSSLVGALGLVFSAVLAAGFAYKQFEEDRYQKEIAVVMKMVRVLNEAAPAISIMHESLKKAKKWINENDSENKTLSLDFSHIKEAYLYSNYIHDISVEDYAKIPEELIKDFVVTQKCISQAKSYILSTCAVTESRAVFSEELLLEVCGEFDEYVRHLREFMAECQSYFNLKGITVELKYAVVVRSSALDIRRKADGDSE